MLHWNTLIDRVIQFLRLKLLIKAIFKHNLFGLQQLLQLFLYVNFLSQTHSLKQIRIFLLPFSLLLLNQALQKGKTVFLSGYDHLLFSLINVQGL